MKLLLTVMLTFATSFAVADKDCSDIDNDRARQECREHNSKDADCSKLGSDNARKECRERKYGSGGKVDCSKLNNDQLRRECRQEKWD